MADSQRWFNPDVMVYNVVISIDQETNGLKPGMSAQVEIICDVIRDNLLAPVTAVHILRGQTAAIVRNGAELEVRRVKVGATNDKEVVIEEGLEEGDMVMLYEPDVMPEIPWEEPKEKTEDIPTLPEAVRASTRPAAEEPGGQAMPKLTPEQAKALQERLKNMTPEQRKQAEQMIKQRGAGDSGRPAGSGTGDRSSGGRRGGRSRGDR